MTRKTRKDVDVYEMQHRVWPGWADGDFGADDDAEAIVRLLGHVGGGRLLDLGCGSGRLSCAMARRGWQVEGIDISADLIERAKARALRQGLSNPPAFHVADIRSFGSQKTYDLVVLWDSVLAIWPWTESESLLVRIAETLVAPGGWLAIGQLNPKFFSEQPDFTTTIENPAIGPGRTCRRYTYDAPSGLLCDDVTVVHGPKETTALPTQRLHLVEAARIEAALGKAGFTDLVTCGSDGWQWAAGRRAADRTSAQFIAAGRKP